MLIQTTEERPNTYRSSRLKMNRKTSSPMTVQNEKRMMDPVEKAVVVVNEGLSIQMPSSTTMSRPSAPVHRYKGRFSCVAIL